MSVDGRPVPRGFRRYLGRAGRLLDDPQRTAALLARALRRLPAEGSGRLQALRDDVRTLVALCGAVVRGEYRGVEPANLARMLAALLYFVVPFDVVPDFVVAAGLLDDAVVLRYVLGLVGQEVERFRRWQHGAGHPGAGHPGVVTTVAAAGGRTC